MGSGADAATAVLFGVVAVVSEVRRSRHEGLDSPRYGFLRSPGAAVTGFFVIGAVFFLALAVSR